MSGSRIALLAQPGDATNIVYHALAKSFSVDAVVLEDPVPKSAILKRRLIKLGPRAVLGQLAFRSLLVPLLYRRSRPRIRKIIEQFQLDRSPIPEAVLVRVPSVNERTTWQTLRERQPSLVVVNGTRIISSQTLAAAALPFVNVHVGITPLYRGVHGGYWALAQGDADHCGVTVHLVDSGIDTGGILGQATIRPAAEDNFITYPYLQYAAAVPLLIGAVSRLLAGDSHTLPAPFGESRLWTHPTIGQYLANRLQYGVR